MHEAVFKYRLANARHTIGATHQPHKRRLQISGETWIGFGGDRRCLRAPIGADNMQAHIGLAKGRARQAHGRCQRAQCRLVNAGQRHRAAGRCDSQRKSACLNAVAGDGMIGAVQFLDPLNGQNACAQAVNLRTHSLQASADINHFRLSGGIGDNGFAFGQTRRHQQHMRRANRDEREIHSCAFKAAFGCCVHIAALDRNISAHGGQAVQI